MLNNFSGRYRGFAIVLSNLWTVITSFHWDEWGNFSPIDDNRWVAASARSQRGLYAGPASAAAMEPDEAGSANRMAPQHVAKPRKTTDQSQASKRIWAHSLNNIVGY